MKVKKDFVHSTMRNDHAFALKRFQRRTLKSSKGKGKGKRRGNLSGNHKANDSTPETRNEKENTGTNHKDKGKDPGKNDDKGKGKAKTFAVDYSAYAQEATQPPADISAEPCPDDWSSSAWRATEWNSNSFCMSRTDGISRRLNRKS